MPDKVITFAPATVGNTGPCYDILGYALDHVGDFVELEKIPRSRHPLVWGGVTGPVAPEIVRLEPKENTAWIAVDHLITRYWPRDRRTFSLRLTLHKYLPIGSGMGSSAASAVAAAKATIELLGLELTQRQIVEALEVAEEVTSGTGYPDNVVPGYFGGLQAIYEPDDGAPNECSTYTRIDGGTSMLSVVVRPALPLMTTESRSAVRQFIYGKYLHPEYVDPDRDQAAINVLNLLRTQSAKAVEIILAYQRNDIARLGALMRSNALLEGARGKLIPNFPAVKAAAEQAGAYGCTISGAGPALVAITDSDQKATAIRDAMIAAFSPLRTHWVISAVNNTGASVISSINNFIAGARASNSFYE